MKAWLEFPLALDEFNQPREAFETAGMTAHGERAFLFSEFLSEVPEPPLAEQRPLARRGHQP